MIVVYVVLCLAVTACSQTVKSIQNPNAENGCNVVNVHFGKSDEEGGNSHLRGSPGVPGKRGAQGVTGPRGIQGETGNKGEKGSMPDVTVLKRETARMLSVSSCSELKEDHGISTAGYYLFQNNGSPHGNPVYRYCDFRAYPDVSDCSNLKRVHGTSTSGFYLMRSDQSSNRRLVYRYCDFRDVFTCHQLHLHRNVSESGFYTLGSSGAKYEVFCNFWAGQAITEVWHNSMNEIKATKCEPRSCYTRSPVYRLSMNKIVTIIDHSHQCRQFIKFRCQGVLFFRENNVGWISRGGDTMRYWGDVPSRRSGYCACGETGSCINNSFRCNCDQNSNSIMTQDEGYLTDKSKLPVKTMISGDMGDANENGWYTLGKLECSG